ncbi:pentatricopeptide repeat-containing protein At1g14470-like [Coffea arabica]|uniref:Pentatricopeptide repeat-containing protein At1g14470-like n=1 Tax=Coffea arabica TaxID=13443 RepID=A0ABM4WW77_COFAR|nr:pentatricopeptide repeat-containing protein At1g14470 [Coffea arabica]
MSHFNFIAKQIRSQNQLKQLHAQLIQNSLHNQDFWVAQLIHLCTRLHAAPRYTTQVFYLAPQPDVFVCSNMLKYHSQMGATNEVFALFDQMQEANVKPVAFVYPLLIKSSGKAGIQFHAHLLKRGLNYDKYIQNAVMGFYCKYGPIESARELFDMMPERTIADWNSIISGYWNWGNEVEAQKLFDLMPEKNVITWTAMVSGYAKVNDLESARRYFDKMPEKSTVSWNAMISGYAHNGLAQEAIELFNEMMSFGLTPDETTCVAVVSSCSMLGDPGLAESLVKRIAEKGTCPNHFVKTALLDMYAKCGNLNMARKIFDGLGECRNLVTWNAMIAAYTRVGDLASAMGLFHQMPKKNVISWNSIIAGCSQNGESAMAIELFKEMIASKDLKPDEVTMVSVISACGHLGALELGNWVANYLTENQIRLSILGCNSLIFMYSKCGSMRKARKIFEEMENRDVISYNTLTTGFAAYGSGAEALELLSKMKQESMQPDRITYIGILTACSHSGLLEEGKAVFKSIKDPDIDHYACMVDLYSRVGKLDEAKRLIDNMPMHPHAGIYGSLLNASRVHKRIDLGEFTANKLFELEPENSGNYVLLSNIYASAGRWEDADRIRGLMKAGGVAKATGWSWVEHGGKIHRFVVGDHSHKLSDDIYRVLGEMKKKMMVAGYMADKSCVLRDVEEEEKEEMVGTHSEKLAVAFALLISEPGAVIRVVKNLRVCRDCHMAIKIISHLEKREIIVRDNNRFHCFRDGLCSCNDYW